jgi:hypothetical protein
MTRTRATKLLLGTTVALSAFTIAACCKSKDDEDIAPIASVEPVVTPEEPASAEPPPVLETPDPDWKTKCPDAERPETGTVTALKTLHIYEKPDVTSKKLEQINRGTWVNLLGAKGTWYCIDYPCEVGKLCPGWVEVRYTQRKIVDAGVVDVVVPDVVVKDVAVDTAAPKDAGKKMIRIPRLKFKLTEGGTPIKAK